MPKTKDAYEAFAGAFKKTEEFEEELEEEGLDPEKVELEHFEEEE